MILEGFILFARILLVLFHVWKGRLFCSLFLNVNISMMVFLFSIPCMVDFPYRMEDFDTQFEFSDVISRWSFYNLLVLLKVETGL